MRKKQSTSNLSFFHQSNIFDTHLVSGMGTRLEPTFNPLATSVHISNKFTVQRVNDWHHFQDSTKFFTPAAMSTGLDKFHEVVNKMLRKGDVDAIKKTMQVHEDVFKDQVKELHRLYSVQKMLMEELRKQTKQNTSWGAMKNSGINQLQLDNRENSTAQTTGELIFNLQSLRSDDPSSRERSGSCSGDNMRMSRGFDLERPAEEDMSTGVSTVDEDQAGPSTLIVEKSNKMSIDGCEEDSNVELTLSIGGSLGKKRSKSFPPLTQKDRDIGSSLSFKSERGEECSDPTTPMSSSSATFDQETKRPHWLFQSLKLK